MRDRTVKRVESWDARPFSGGFESLRELSDGSFSGVLVSGDSWLFMLNGRIVGIVGGDLDEFEDASGTMYAAPDPSLPLLFSMQERGGTTQAKYYTNDTPLEEADQTLRDANFTGYVELSENVLSGDYYLVYYGGRVLPVAFVGTSNELKTGDEAYDLAADEVGVYEVIKTPVDVTTVPEPEEPTDGSETAVPVADAEASEDADASEHTDADSSPETPDAIESAESTESTTTAESTDTVDAAEATDESETAAAPDAAKPAESAASDVPDEADATSETGPDSPTTDGASVGSPSQSADPSAATETGGAVSADETATNGGSTADTTESDQRSVFSEEEQWRQTRSIPSLSPSEREKREERPGSAAEQADTRSRARAEERDETTDGEPSTSPDAGQQDTARPSESSSASSTESRTPARDEPASSGTAADSTKVTELQGRVDELESTRADLESELDSVRSERDDLERRVGQLESALEESGGTPAPGPSLTPDEALAGTNLFIRYGSKGQPTLEDLQGKTPDREAINKNLRIDHHTQFESDDATVDGVPFGRFLEQSSAYRFVSWIVRDLPYEVIDSGHRSGLADLYGAIPAIDRIELHGSVDVETEDGTESRAFDVVLRDRMGNPLVVAELNDARDPVSGEEMADLVDSAMIVGEDTDDLGAAFYVTASFFEPDALENAAEATANGGILSRSDRASYVKLARKRGFHLCLAEDRNDTFHLTVPEL